MLTNFYNTNGELLIAGETIEMIYIYKNEEILGYFREVKEHEIKNNKITDVYDGDVRNAIIDFEIKKANKVNLSRNDAFYTKNPEKKYAIDKAYVLYINADLVKFENLGDVLATEFDHEKNYFETYKITFNSCTFKRNKIERIVCDNYTLKEGERFGECYGYDKEHACIDSFICENTPFARKHHPEKIGEKGILRKWFENETINNCELLVTRPYYSKTIKDEYRTQQDELCNELKNAGFKFSHYDIERLRKAGFDIVRKGA